MSNPAKNTARRQRLRVIEELMLNGYRTREIFDMVGERYNICFGTVRNDIVKIHKSHKEEHNDLTELQGREVYLASLRQLRRKALTGWTEADNVGTQRIKGRDFKLAHSLDKEIAKISGVDLKGETLELTLGKARDLMDRAMIVVFNHVKDDLVRKRIVDELTQIDE